GGVGRAGAVGEQVTGAESDEDRPQGHLIGGDPRRVERPRDADPDGPEEPQIGPLLNRLPLMRQVVVRLHRAPPSGSRGPSSPGPRDRKSTRLNSSHGSISYAVFCLKKKTLLPVVPRA